MPSLIINEMEFLPGKPEERPALSVPLAEAEPPPVIPNPEDIIRVERLYRERRRRLRAN